MPYLSFNLNNGTEFVFDLIEERLTVGRDQKNDIVITFASISGQHAEFRRASDGTYEVVDIESEKGTFVNGERVQRASLKGGDRITFGALECRYRDTVRPSRIPKPRAPKTEKGVPMRVKLMIAFAVLICGGFMALMGLRVTGWLRAFQVPTNAMAPALVGGDQIYASSFPLLHRLPQRGEIVVFSTAGIQGIRTPTDEPQYWVKRVVGLPGDRVQIVNEKVVINGQPAKELEGLRHSVVGNAINLASEVTVPLGECLVLGDNTDNSADSRYFGYVPLTNIHYVYAFHYWRASGPRDPETLNRQRQSGR